MFCGLFLINPIGQYINLHTHTWWDDETLVPRLKSYRGYIAAASAIGAIIALCMTHTSSPLTAALTTAVVFTMVAAGTWNATLVPMLNMLGFRTSSVAWSVASSLTGLITSISFVMLWPTAISWFAGQALGMLIGALGARHYLMSRTRVISYRQSRLPLLTKQVALAYCLPLALAAGLMWIQLSGYRFAIEHYWGLAQLGFFAVGLQLAGQIWALAESLAIQFLYPFFFRRVSEHSNNSQVELAVSDLLNTLIPAYLLLAGLTILTAPYLLKLLVAPEYNDAWQFMAVGAVVELCRALGNILSNAAHVKRKTTSLAAPYAIGATVILICILSAGKYQLDISWAGVALLAGAITMLFAMFINMYRQVKFKLDLPRCLSSFLIMLGMSAFVAYTPPASTWFIALSYISIMAAFAASLLFMMLWKNPATSRLLDVQLRKI